MAHFDSNKKLENWEKFIPNQDFISDLYNESLPIEKSIFNLIFNVCNLQVPKKKFVLQESDLFSIEEMASSPVALMFIKFIIKLINAKNILEIGTFVGVGSLHMAEDLPEDGKLITIEKFKKFADVAKTNFKKNNLDHKIKLICGDAEEVLKTYNFGKKFDLIFIDGAKEKYEEFLKFASNKINDGGIIFIDDALFHGDVLNKNPQTEKGCGVKKSIYTAKELNGFDKTFLPLSNGVMLLRKN